MKKMKREVDVVVISDVHLGTFGCHAEELVRYLKSVKIKTLILNGDIIDIWQFSKKYWPTSHMLVIKHITSLMSKGVKIYYIPGNHDETLRKFTGFRLGSFRIVNKVVMNLDGRKAWIFHGDVFDVTMKHSKWLAKLGATGYDLLILINRFVNNLLRKFGKEKISLSKRIKDGVKGAVKHMNNFEQTAADIAISNAYDYVICGHIHKPVIKEIRNDHGTVSYLNSGDWIENLTALEYHEGKWSIYHYDQDAVAKDLILESENNKAHLSNHEIFDELLREFMIFRN